MRARSPDFAQFQAICETKARYCRCLDSKDWAGYGEVFTEDAVLDSSAAGGQVVLGRATIVDTIRGAIGKAVTVHQVHSPEISMIGSDEAEVTWAMQDRVIWDADKARAIGRKSLTGFGHYRETYRLDADGTWRIAFSKLTRLHVDFELLDGA
jgi:hypothetical protein